MTCGKKPFSKEKSCIDNIAGPFSVPTVTSYSTFPKSRQGETTTKVQICGLRGSGNTLAQL